MVTNASEVTIKDSSFALTYLYAGLGSNMGKQFPYIEINGTQLLLLNRQNSSLGKPTLKTDTIMIRTLPYAFRDSINTCLDGMRDTNISVTNVFILSGGIDYLSIRNGMDTVHFSMHNTAHLTALKITKQINHYLPNDHQIWLDEKMIKREDDCLKWFQKNRK